ncbi:HAD-IIA family hydrolase [Amycolatopsis anabasis]|uniref:HAD-IIA family hydrolase n=1 Tax=Amycolatopsis anabasis TaxID=1840409 RepID=UPI00131B7F10|nr:HAD-IIA family hydrolase [Amycolatopsis anabasis]
MSDSLLAVHDAVLLDLDGTVYHGTRSIPGVAEVIRAAREATAVRYVTNNASKAPGEVAAHLAALGIDADPHEVNTSAQAAAKVLAERLPAGAVVLVVGTASLEAEVRAVGLRPTRAVSDEVAAVVQGHSPETGWADLAEACLAIRGGALWVATNVDATLPSERGLLPGNGSMVTALRAATEREPVVAGKPARPLFETAAESAGANKPLVVGDRLDTDIAGAVAAELDALVVLTGVATPAQLLAAGADRRPKYLSADLTSLTEPADLLEIGPQEGWQVRVADGGLTVSVRGGGDALGLLRALCGPAWESGVTTVRAADEAARAALTELSLT